MKWLLWFLGGVILGITLLGYFDWPFFLIGIIVILVGVLIGVKEKKNKKSKPQSH